MRIVEPNFFSTRRLGACPLRNPGSAASFSSVSTEEPNCSLTVSAGITMEIFFRQGPASVMVTLFVASFR